MPGQCWGWVQGARLPHPVGLFLAVCPNTQADPRLLEAHTGGIEGMHAERWPRKDPTRSQRLPDPPVTKTTSLTRSFRRGWSRSTVEASSCTASSTSSSSSLSRFDIFSSGSPNDWWRQRCDSASSRGSPCPACCEALGAPARPPLPLSPIRVPTCGDRFCFPRLLLAIANGRALCGLSAEHMPKCVLAQWGEHSRQCLAAVELSCC